MMEPAYPRPAFQGFVIHMLAVRAWPSMSGCSGATPSDAGSGRAGGVKKATHSASVSKGLSRLKVGANHGASF